MQAEPARTGSQALAGQVSQARQDSRPGWPAQTSKANPDREPSNPGQGPQPLGETESATTLASKPPVASWDLRAVHSQLAPGISGEDDRQEIGTELKKGAEME